MVTFRDDEYYDKKDAEIGRLRAKRVSNRKMRRALRAVLQYLWTDEEHDFCEKDDVTLGKHIFSSLIVLSEWCKQNRSKHG